MISRWPTAEADSKHWSSSESRQHVDLADAREDLHVDEAAAAHEPRHGTTKHVGCIKGHEELGEKHILVSDGGVCAAYLDVEPRDLLARASNAADQLDGRAHARVCPSLVLQVVVRVLKKLELLEELVGRHFRPVDCWPRRVHRAGSLVVVIDGLPDCFASHLQRLRDVGTHLVA